MSAFSREFLEAISSWSEVLAAVFATLAALSGIAYLLSTRPLRAMEARENAILQQKTATAQKESAEAQLALKKYLDEVARKQGPRAIPDEMFRSTLKKAPPKKVIMLYQEGSTETYIFADHLRGLLVDAGWKASELSSVPSLVGIGGGTGLREIIVVMKHPELAENPSTSEGALWSLLLVLRIGIGQVKDDSLPEDTFKMFVGPRI